VTAKEYSVEMGEGDFVLEKTKHYLSQLIKVNIKNDKPWPGVVVHACNPSYLRERDPKD
jgi:hypothetical protein